MGFQHTDLVECADFLLTFDVVFIICKHLEPAAQTYSYNMDDMKHSIQLKRGHINIFNTALSASSLNLGDNVNDLLHIIYQRCQNLIWSRFIQVIWQWYTDDMAVCQHRQSADSSASPFVRSNLSWCISMLTRSLKRSGWLGLKKPPDIWSMACFSSGIRL